MITVILLIVLIGITLVCGVIAAADVVSPWLEPKLARLGRRVKRELMARWLTEYGLTVVPVPEAETALAPMRREEELKRRVGYDEMMEIIGRI